MIHFFQLLLRNLFVSLNSFCYATSGLFEKFFDYHSLCIKLILRIPDLTNTGQAVSTTPFTATGCQQCLPLSVVQLKGKHCQNTHCRNGVKEYVQGRRNKIFLTPTYFEFGKSIADIRWNVNCQLCSLYNKIELLQTVNTHCQYALNSKFLKNRPT